MRQPESQWDQYFGKAKAELWRGSGLWPLQQFPCDLEPPWESYEPSTVNAWDCLFNNWEGAWQPPPSLFSRLSHNRRVFSPGNHIQLPPFYPNEEAALDENEHLVPIVIEQFSEDIATIPQAEQLLLSLSRITRPVAFEVLGLGPQPTYDMAIFDDEILEARRENREPIGWLEPSTTIKFIAHRNDADQLKKQLLAFYPNSAVVVGKELDKSTDSLPGHDLVYEMGFCSSLVLANSYLYPLRMYTKLDADPLGVAIASMENLGHYEWAMVQVVFMPAIQPWESTLFEALRNPYRTGGDFIFEDINQHQLQTKFSSPLFAVAVRVAALRQEHYLQLQGWANQFAAPPQALQEHFDQGSYGDLGFSLMARCTFHPGFLLNASELSGLIHLPGPTVTSERLRRIRTRTKAAPKVDANPGSIVLGKNIHRGVTCDARISAELRPRHCYIAGASGTGKSTLLLNMIRQDIQGGAGVGVIDPHGDLIDGVLSLIPRQRMDDVAYFNPTDSDHPPAFNILSYRDRADRQRIASDTVTTIHRFYPDAWGPRLEHILRYTLTTILKSRSATLMHLKRLLTDANYRQYIVEQLRDDNLRSFWVNEFEGFPKGSVDPILNKLSPFLLNPITRNIICQPKSSFDFDHLLNNSKIFLANLSKGSLGDEVAGVLGTFIMGRIVNAAFRRDKIPEHNRVPFYLYVDEFQNFMDLSVGFEQILAEARKYKLILAGLANQYVGQLSQDVRQAVFGNVGTLLTFRLGVSDSRLIANEFGEFTPEEIMSLERGQAIARMGGTQTAFNLTTPPPPDNQPEAIRREIIGCSRKKYTMPRADVERSFQTAPSSTPRPRQPLPTNAIQPSPVPGSVHTTSTAPPETPEYLAPDQPDDADDFVS